MRRVHIVHAGCRLNQYETDALTAGFDDNNIAPVNDIRSADLIIFNTCTVTNRADYKNRNAIRKAHEANPSAELIVTGCYATTDAEEISQLPGVSRVVANSQKASIPQAVSSGGRLVDNRFRYSYRRKEGHARAYLKIQDGCNRTCSYCKIPNARGAGISRSSEETLKEAEHLISLGFKELILTGVNIGCYLSEEGDDFYTLTRRIAELDGEFIIRISSIEPGEVNSRLAELMYHRKMARFLHVPLQSGSKEILRLMRRGYTPQTYRDKIRLMRAEHPDLHIGTDIITGFPGETAELFRETLAFSEEMQFANIHIFPFSKRRDTHVLNLLAERRVEEINGRIIRERNAQLSELKNRMAARYREKLKGQIVRAIVEKPLSDGGWHILTENYLRFDLPQTISAAYHLSRGDLLQVRIDTTDSLTLL